MDTLSHDMVSHLIDTLHAQSLEHQEGWRRKKGDNRIFHVCNCSFAFACAGQTCKLWRELVLDAWQKDPKLLSTLALMKVYSNMELAAGVFDEDEDDSDKDEDEDEDEDAPSWKHAECALIVGFETNYYTLREALCTGRRFFQRIEVRDGETYCKNGEELVESNLLEEPMPDDASKSFYYEEVPSVQELRHGLLCKYAMPERVAEVSRALQAKGGLFDVQCFCTGGESSADDTVVVGVKIGDVHWRHAQAVLGGLDELCDDSSRGAYSHEAFFALDDDDDLAEFLDPFAPPIHAFRDALRPLATKLISDFWGEANPKHGDMHEATVEPTFFIGGQAGSQRRQKYELAAWRLRNEEQSADEGQA